MLPSPLSDVAYFHVISLSKVLRNSNTGMLEPLKEESETSIMGSVTQWDRS